MDFQTLSAFLAVADAGSFSAAGERLFLSQPAISKRIATLEAGLDQPLFDRIGRRVTLTDAGRALLPYARRALDDLEVKVEVSSEVFSDEIRGLEVLQHSIRERMKSLLGLSAKVTLVEPGSIERSMGKAKRVLDLRGQA